MYDLTILYKYYMHCIHYYVVLVCVTVHKVCVLKAVCCYRSIYITKMLELSKASMDGI